MNSTLLSKGRSKRGFTLLETLLSVALLLILSLIVYQGFMTTLKLSTNTLNYQKSANTANSGANTALSSKVTGTGVNKTIRFDPPVNITGLGDYVDLDVTVYKATPPSPVILGPENSAMVTANRYSFRYVPPPAPPGT